jgi:hypothetical protein
MSDTNSVYHVYCAKSKSKVIAHNLTYDELSNKILNDEFDLESIEILKLSKENYHEDVSY